MLSKLPIEIQKRLLMLGPRSNLKNINSHFYILYNNLFYDKILQLFGCDIARVLITILPWIKSYIRTLDLFRYTSRRAIASRLNLHDDNTSVDLKPQTYMALLNGTTNCLNCAFIQDSWRYIYSLLKNRRLFAEHVDYQIDEPQNYINNHFVDVNRTYLLSYKKSCWLSSGSYNLNIGVMITSGSGLGTTKFELKYRTSDNEECILGFSPPTDIKDILPKNQFCLINIAKFVLPTQTSLLRNANSYLVTLLMEEIGISIKLGFRIYFIEIAQQLMLFNDYDLLYYTVRETDYRYFIHLPLKNLYKALSLVESFPVHYNQSDLESVFEDEGFDYNLSIGLLSSYPGSSSAAAAHNTHVPYDCEGLLEYGRFFFNENLSGRRYKFKTIHQQRQFTSRFGDYLLDREYEKNFTLNLELAGHCKYDLHGLRWKMPILSNLN